MSLNSLKDAPKEYDQERERIFRRELETYLLQLSQEVNSISFGNNTASSLYSKRESLLIPAVGVKTIG